MHLYDGQHDDRYNVLTLKMIVKYCLDGEEYSGLSYEEKYI